MKNYCSSLFFVVFCLVLSSVATSQQAISFPVAVPPLKMAIIPCEVLGLLKSDIDQTMEDHRRLESGISTSLQANVYRTFIDRVMEEESQTVEVQTYLETNTLLGSKGVNLPRAWKMPAAELAELLGVDAVLRIKISQTKGHMVDISGPDNAGAPRENPCLTGERGRTRVSAILADGKTGLPLWHIGQQRPMNLGRKHQRIAERITNSLVKFFE